MQTQTGKALHWKYYKKEAKLFGFSTHIYRWRSKLYVGIFYTDFFLDINLAQPIISNFLKKIWNSIVHYRNLDTWIYLGRFYPPRFYLPRYNLGRFYLHRYYPSWFYPGSLLGTLNELPAVVSPRLLNGYVICKVISFPG